MLVKYLILVIQTNCGNANGKIHYALEETCAQQENMTIAIPQPPIAKTVHWEVFQKSEPINVQDVNLEVYLIQNIHYVLNALLEVYLMKNKVHA
jgi:hypothetical protein